MKVQVSNTNAPCWRDITVKSRVPAQLDILQEMARNISWVWHIEAIEMFRSIDPVLWKSTNGNPVLMLQQINYERLEEIAADIERRDYADMHREISPLKQAEDAILVDTSDMNIEEVVAKLTQIIEEKKAS